ncbi:MAG: MBL fold metallo-hydrolase [Gaiellaceae bacterium]
MKLRVRMYRQGLGDCFLITCTEGDETSHLLIDCGVLKGTPDAKTRMNEVAESVYKTTGGHLDRLVVTHEHWDHLSGFLQAQPVFDTLSVGEVWLAWTEDPKDELAAELRHRKEKRLKGLVAAQQLAEGRTKDVLEALLGFQGDFGAAGTQTTGKALEWVKGRDADVKFLQPGDQLFDLPGLPGIRVYVLGPPHDSRLIKRSDPSKRHPEVYELAATAGSHQGFLAAAEAQAEGEQAGARPFDDFFRVDEAKARREEALWNSYYAGKAAWRRVDRDWLGYAGPLALQLDSDTNNTSLVLAFELPGGDVILFPGDAQVGNWLSWELLEWQVDGRTVKSDELLARTVLYKVGHHGSHNATLREKGLELMASNALAAMIPVNRVTAKKMDWLMPFPALHDRLVAKTRGRVLDAERGLDDAEPRDLAAEDWQAFLERTDVQPGWIDYTVSL